MLIDQALHALPEILCGSGYPKHDHEGGVVTALTMAVLQELNGRNIANPLSLLQAERLYWSKASASKFAGRHLRADFSLRLDTLRVGNVRIETYGWRLQNWLEAKFFRDEADRATNKHSTNKTTHTADLLADLIRLATLVPESKPRNRKTPWRTFNGRYLLHVYDAAPELYLASRKNKTKTSPKSFTRNWIAGILTPGTQTVEVKNLADEGDTVRERLGNISRLELELRVTNREVRPTTAINSVSGAAYWCHLTRIDAIKARVGSATFELSEDRTIRATSGKFEKIRHYVAENIGVAEESPDLSMPPDEGEIPTTLQEAQGGEADD